MKNLMQHIATALETMAVTPEQHRLLEEQKLERYLIQKQIDAEKAAINKLEDAQDDSQIA